MITVNIRKQGGAAVVTIPPHILKTLNIEIGSTLKIEIQDGRLIAQPLKTETRKRYTLAELLKGATPKSIAALNEETSWVQDGEPTGRELL